MKRLRGSRNGSRSTRGYATFARRNTEFPVYDHRAHILGATVLSAVYEAAHDMTEGTDDAVLIVSRAKFMRKVSNNGVIEIALDEPTAEKQANCAAEIVGRMGSHSLVARFLPDPGRGPTADLRSAHQIEGLVSEVGFGGRCRFIASGVDAVLRGLVDINKHVHLKSAVMLAGDVTSELLSIEDLSIDSALNNIDTEVVVRNISARSAFGRLVTLSELGFFNSGGMNQKARISMSFHSADAQDARNTGVF